VALAREIGGGWTSPWLIERLTGHQSSFWIREAIGFGWLEKRDGPPIRKGKRAVLYRLTPSAVALARMMG
jgi:hypothetical protein